jgi:hypothetical protein
MQPKNGFAPEGEAGLERKLWWRIPAENWWGSVGIPPNKGGLTIVNLD